MAFRWRADDGQLIEEVESPLPSSTIKMLPELITPWQNFLDLRMDETQIVVVKMQRIGSLYIGIYPSYTGNLQMDIWKNSEEPNKIHKKQLFIRICTVLQGQNCNIIWKS